MGTLDGGIVSDEGSLQEAIKTMELWTLDPAVRSSRELMDEMLADDFIEFGQSGRVYTKGEILERIPSLAGDFYEMVDFQSRSLGQTHILILYRLIHTHGVSNRSSIWRREGDRWRMLFHQGTQIPCAKVEQNG